jgi:hypothetical protein
MADSGFAHNSSLRMVFPSAGRLAPLAFAIAAFLAAKSTQNDILTAAPSCDCFFLHLPRPQGRPSW